MDGYKSTETLLGLVLHEPPTGTADDDSYKSTTGGAGCGKDMNIIASSATTITATAGNNGDLYTSGDGSQETLQFILGAYDDAGGNNGFNRNGRPVSMYEPWYDYEEQVSLPQGYTSLPPDLINQTSGVKYYDPAAVKSSWEAEDTDEFITTLDETTILDIESLENINEAGMKCELFKGQYDDNYTASQYWNYSTPNLQTSKEMVVAVDVHSSVNNTDEVNIYATIRKQGRDKQIRQQQQVQYHSSGGPIEKIPKIMTASCYGELNASNTMQTVPDSDFIQDSETGIVSITNSIMDERSSLNSSMFEPTSLISSIDGNRYGQEIYKPEMNNASGGGVSGAGGSEKGRVKWWDENDQPEHSDFQQIVKQGKLNAILYFVSLIFTIVPQF